jgi:hypothetical protein
MPTNVVPLRMEVVEELVAACYDAATPFGPVRLTARGETPVRHAADAAIALIRHDSLLDALEAWIGQPLDWRWTASPQPASVARVAICTSDPGCEVALPLTLLRALPAPQDVLRQRLRWPEVPVVCAIAALNIPADEMAQLEPGGAVVLPDSLRPDWHGVLRALEAPAADAGVPVALPSPATPGFAPRLRARAERQHAASAAQPYEVRLAAPRTLPGEYLTGWSDRSLGDLATQASLWRVAVAASPACCLAIGRLIPWGTGWALAIETLCGSFGAVATA